jgi:prepilin-type processing-associated H-X9-DG protein
VLFEVEWAGCVVRWGRVVRQLVEQHMRKQLAICVGLVCGLSAGLAGGQEAVNRGHDLFRGAKSAYALLPPEFVAGSDVSWAEWSPSGQFILGTRSTRKLTPEVVRALVLDVAIPEDPRAETSLFVWSASAKKVTRVWDARGNVRVEGFRWIGRSDRALASVFRSSVAADGSLSTDVALLHIDTTTAKTRTLMQVSGSDEEIPKVDAYSAPTLDYAIVVLQSPPTRGATGGITPGRASVSIVRGDGKPAGPIQLPNGSMMPVPYLSKDRKQAFLCVRAVDNSPAGEKPGMSATWMALDLAKNSLSPCSRPEGATPMLGPTVRDAVPELRISTEVQSIGKGTSARTMDSVWLAADGAPDKKGRPSTALIAAESPYADLNPTGDSVLYILKGSLFVRKIQKLSLEDFEEAYSIQDRREIMANAKQIGLALMMSAADNDGRLPGSEGLGDSLYRYLKDGGYSSGFVYTFGGGRLDDIQNPADTQLGYIDGPGGRAVLFGDGHVKWVRG